MLHDDQIIDLVRETLMVTLRIIAPILGAGVLIGLFVSIVQSITSIQDQTITFVPKIVSMVVVAIVLAHWIVGALLEFARDMLTMSL